VCFLRVFNPTPTPNPNFFVHTLYYCTMLDVYKKLE
jgi:hypothetical protein